MIRGGSHSTIVVVVPIVARGYIAIKPRIDCYRVRHKRQQIETPRMKVIPLIGYERRPTEAKQQTSPGSVKHITFSTKALYRSSYATRADSASKMRIEEMAGQQQHTRLLRREPRIGKGQHIAPQAIENNIVLKHYGRLTAIGNPLPQEAVRKRTAHLARLWTPYPPSAISFVIKHLGKFGIRHKPTIDCCHKFGIGKRRGCQLALHSLAASRVRRQIHNVCFHHDNN